MPTCSRVRHEYQLDGSANGPFDCGRAAAVTLIDHGSRGLYRPTTEQVGRRMGNTTGTSTVLDRKKAVESYDKEMRRKGYRPLKYRAFGSFTSTGWIFAGAGRDGLLNGIKRGEMADVVINYGVLKQVAPAYITSSTSFTGNHSVTAGGKRGWRKKGGNIWVRVLDPIARRARWWKFQWLWKAADGTWSSKGGRGWIGGLVKCTTPLPSIPPLTDLVDEALLIACRSRVADLETALSEAQDVIEALQARRIPKAIAADIAALAEEIKAYVEPADSGQQPESGEGDTEA